MPNVTNLPIQLIAYIAYAIISLVMAFYSGVAIYSLLHFGKSQMIGFVASTVYSTLTLILLIHSLILLMNI